MGKISDTYQLDTSRGKNNSKSNIIVLIFVLRKFFESIFDFTPLNWRSTLVIEINSTFL